jgi:antitoxin component of MazEF toxin-antitoxin module
MEIQGTLRRWGNSFGIVVPVKIVRENRLREGEEITIKVERNKGIKEMFGSLKLKKSAQQIKDELRKEWSKW